MKGFRVFTKSWIFVFILSALAFAQTANPQNSATGKIGLIDTEVFGNKETGIREIVEAYDKLESEIKPQKDELVVWAEKIQKLEKEIGEFQLILKKYPGACVSMKEIEEYDKLITEYKKQEQTAKSFYDKRKSEIFADVYKKVGGAIQQFAKEKGYALIIDSAKLNDGVILGELDDITKEFIKYYNENFVKAVTQ
jgi:Skp family chaperone for outer membrane proteins